MSSSNITTISDHIYVNPWNTRTTAGSPVTPIISSNPNGWVSDETEPMAINERYTPFNKIKIGELLEINTLTGEVTFLDEKAKESMTTESREFWLNFKEFMGLLLKENEQLRSLTEKYLALYGEINDK